MGKLCFESVTKLIGQLILLAKYGGPEVRDVKCSQRTQFLTKLKLERICFNITQIIMVENEAISNIFASFQEYIDTEQDIREVCIYPYYRPVTTCREKRTPRNKLNL